MRAVRLHGYHQQPVVEEVPEPTVQGPFDVVVKIGSVVVADKQPALGEVTDVVRERLPPCGAKVVVLRAAVPYFVDVAVDSTFVPAEIDASSGDVRELGAQVRFDFLPL